MQGQAEVISFKKNVLFVLAVPCSAGEFSRTGLTPCYPCPRDYYQPDPGKSYCLSCPFYGTTTIIGARSITDCSSKPYYLSWKKQASKGWPAVVLTDKILDFFFSNDQNKCRISHSNSDVHFYFGLLVLSLCNVEGVTVWYEPWLNNSIWIYRERMYVYVCIYMCTLCMCKCMCTVCVYILTCVHICSRWANGWWVGPKGLW